MFKVLLIDDEPFVTKALKILIEWEKYGYYICGEASNGENAIKIIENKKPDIIITDIRMPKMDGIDLIKYCSEILKVNSKFIILSGYGDFKYAQKAIKYGVKEYLLKPIDEDELIEMLINFKKELEEDLKTLILEDQKILFSINRHVEKILKGQGDSKCEEILNEELKICCGEDLRCMVINIDSENNSNIKSEIYSMLKEKFNFKTLKLTENYIQVIIKDSNQKLSKMRCNFETILSELINNYGAKASFMISGKMDSVLQLNEAYDHIKMIMNYKFYKNDKNIIFYEDIMSINFNYSFEKVLSVGDLVEAIEKGEEVLIRNSIEYIFGEFYESLSAMEVIKTYINNLMVEIIKIVNDMGSDAKKFILENSPLVDSMDKSNFKKVKEETLNLCLKSIFYINSHKMDNLKYTMKEIERYIKQHYMDDINLKLISKRFYMNSVYLGQQFKKCFGTYFNDYLNEIRINEAKRLLTRTNKKIYEIAPCVGYKNTDYFVGRFEKNTNMTPSEYRNIKIKIT